MKLRTLTKLMLFLVGTALVTISCDADNPVKPDTGPENSTVAIELTDFDHQPPGEAVEIDEIADQTVELQEERARVSGLRRRGVHAKAHGCVDAKFFINKNLDEDYKVGLFGISRSGGFDAKIRFSNAAVLVEHDLATGNGSRGMAIKVQDVDGPFLNAYPGQNDQDFLMINTAKFAFPTVRAYGFLTDVLLDSTGGASGNELFKLADPRNTVPMNLVGFSDDDRADVQRTVGIIRKDIQTMPVLNPTQAQYFGAAPYLFGAKRVMKFSAAPCASPVEALTIDDTPDKTTSNHNYLRDALKQSMQGGEKICYNFQIQVRDLADIGEWQDIENASTEWPGEKDNYVNVASIIIEPGQDIDSEDAKDKCEKLVFTPWHSLAAHQPVGGINRLRQDVYSNSAKYRHGSDNTAHTQ